MDKYYLHLFSKLNSEVQTAYSNYQFHQIYQKVLRFCTVELSQDYFEMIRDRLYCDDKNSKTRMSSCTTLSIILENLTILLAPILSFTSEEVWKSYGKNDSIFLQPFLDLKEYYNPKVEEEFLPLFPIKTLVQKCMEDARQKGEIGKSLEARIHIASKQPIPFSTDELELFLVVSQVEKKKAESGVVSTVTEGDITIEVCLPETKECPRCWKHSRSPKENNLCTRCSEILEKSL